MKLALVIIALAFAGCTVHVVCDCEKKAAHVVQSNDDSSGVYLFPSNALRIYHIPPDTMPNFQRILNSREIIDTMPYPLPRIIQILDTTRSRHDISW